MVSFMFFSNQAEFPELISVALDSLSDVDRLGPSCMMLSYAFRDKDNVLRGGA